MKGQNTDIKKFAARIREEMQEILQNKGLSDKEIQEWMDAFL